MLCKLVENNDLSIICFINRSKVLSILVLKEDK